MKMMESLLSATSPSIDMQQAPHQNSHHPNLSSSSSSSIAVPDRVSPVQVPEFDGETVLCRVCGDKASGFHYGVHACEGCKGFFRRSIQQKIQYRPCLKNQQCNIQRVNRNRCQYCRLKKCISVGMSRDAVRFGRVPKKEKARIIEQMQKQNSASQSSELNNLLSNSMDIVQVVVNAHRHTCDITQFRAHQMRDLALHNGDYVNCPAHMACPLNNEVGQDSDTTRPHNNFSNFSESFTPAIKSVVDFAKGIPGFTLLNQDDQVTLLKAGTFEVLLVRLACLFDPNTNTMMFTKGKLFRRQPTTMTTNAGFLLDSMFDFAERFNKMCLIDDEIAMFSAVVLMSPDRPGIRNLDQVERIQIKLTEALQSIITANHTEDSTLFAKLLMKTTDLRTLNTLHSEKSIAGQRNNNGEDSDMELPDSISTRSGRSSPTMSEASNLTMTSGYSGDTDSSNLVVGQRLPMESSNHQQVVLRTPYGTFFREEMSGFYGMMADQPRRRCNTLDRDTLSRPRLHTIEEGNKRRYTMDRDYMKQLASRLDHLECRGPYRGDSMPPSISNSATSSPIQEEGTSGGAYGGAGSSATASKTPTSSFSPVMGTPDLTPSSTPGAQQGATGSNPHLNTAARSSPTSPKSRSRSGSFSQDTYANMRPRCYSFHLNSEGRAARMPPQRRMQQSPGERGAGDQESDQLSPDGPGSQYLSPEMRRGSVGTAYGLHSRKPSLLVDRPMSYLARGIDGAAARAEFEKRASRGQQGFKHLVGETPIYGMQLTPELAAAAAASTQHHPGLWHHTQASAALALGLAAPPLPIQVMAAQRQREELARSMDTARNLDWEAVTAAAAAAKSHARNFSSSSSSSSLSKTATATSSSHHGDDNASSGNDEGIGIKKEREMKLSTLTGIPTDLSSKKIPSGGGGICPVVPRSSPVEDAGKSSLSVESMEVDSGMESSSSCGVISRSRPKTSNVSNTETSSRKSQNSPEPADDSAVSEKFGHKKFDKFRKVDKNNSATNDGSTSVSVKQEEKSNSYYASSPSAHEEKMEEGDEDEIIKIEEDINNEEREPILNKKVFLMKDERKSPVNANLVNFNSISPVSSNRSSPSPSGSDRPKLSAKEAHPNLLAHLMNGGTVCSSSSKKSPLHSNVNVPGGSKPSSSLGPGFPWAMPVGGLMTRPFSPHHPHLLQQQQQVFKLPGFSNPSQANSTTSLSSPTLPQSSSSSSASSSSSSSPSTCLSVTSSSPFSASQQQMHPHSSSFSSGDGQKQETSKTTSCPRDEFHAVAVSHLKDKLMRKFDSMENLTKIDNSNSSTASSPKSLKEGGGQSCLGERSISASSLSKLVPHNTTELNRELATKLTLSSTVKPSSLSVNTMASSSPSSLSPSSSSSSLISAATTQDVKKTTQSARDCEPNGTISQSSQNFFRNTLSSSLSRTSPVLPSSSSLLATSLSSSSSSSSSPSNLNPVSKSSSPSSGMIRSSQQAAGVFAPDLMVGANGQPPSLPSGISPMLLSQGIHPATLPMYHSMISQQYSNLQHSMVTAGVGGSPARSNTCSSTTGGVIPPLANMQHFAQMYARNHPGASAAGSLDKR